MTVESREIYSPVLLFCAAISSIWVEEPFILISSPPSPPLLECCTQSDLSCVDFSFSYVPRKKITFWRQMKTTTTIFWNSVKCVWELEGKNSLPYKCVLYVYIYSTPSSSSSSHLYRFNYQLSTGVWMKKKTLLFLFLQFPGPFLSRQGCCCCCCTPTQVCPLTGTVSLDRS